MALKLADRLKNINLTESVGVIAESVKGAFEQKQKIENNPESAESVIDSVDSLNGYLASLQAEVYDYSCSYVSGSYRPVELW